MRNTSPRPTAEEKAALEEISRCSVSDRYKRALVIRQAGNFGTLWPQGLWGQWQVNAEAVGTAVDNSPVRRCRREQPRAEGTEVTSARGTTPHRAGTCPDSGAPRPGPARPSAPSAGGAWPRRAMAERSGPRAPRTERTGAAGRAVLGAGPERPPGSRAAAPGLLECRRCRYLRTGRGEQAGGGCGSRFLCPAGAGCPARRPRRGPLPVLGRGSFLAARRLACCQTVEALLAVLILVCSAVSCSSTGGYTGLPSLGGIYYYQYGGAYSGLSGADGEKAQQLDQRFYLLKLPIARAAMAVGGCLLVFSCILILAGVLRLPWRFPAWLLLECVLDVVIAIGIVPALYYFFHFLLGVYNSSVCKEREQLYQSKGYQGFRCSLHGAEIAAGLLGCIAAMAYLLSAGLAVRGYRTVYKLKQKPVQLHKLRMIPLLQ
ncbi:MARVEL domain-containing protein 3 [Gavia stellata]|uniref:MARVEL domain-containing protein 3 n=1 Tax=Gavia stellata TaxID=37040 RepID=UPI0028A0B6FC|nr:MARVEL domain-containing protein 3 [Gavia stellata]